MSDRGNRVSFTRDRRNLTEQDYDSLLRESRIYFGGESKVRGRCMSVQESTPGNGSLDGLEPPLSPRHSRSRSVFHFKNTIENIVVVVMLIIGLLVEAGLGQDRGRAVHLQGTGGGTRGLVPGLGPGIEGGLTVDLTLAQGVDRFPRAGARTVGLGVYLLCLIENVTKETE